MDYLNTIKHDMAVTRTKIELLEVTEKALFDSTHTKMTKRVTDSIKNAHVVIVKDFNYSYISISPLVFDRLGTAYENTVRVHIDINDSPRDLSKNIRERLAIERQNLATLENMYANKDELFNYVEETLELARKLKERVTTQFLSVSARESLRTEVSQIIR